nr:hypothetical protein [Sphingosinicella sp. CPCC 101087]
MKPASPTPTAIRISSSWAKLAAAPQTIVAADHRKVAAAMMFTRLRRSASRANGMPSTE